MKAVQIEKTGGPDVLHLIDAPEPEIKNDQILVRQAAIGLNFIDTCHRAGLYPVQLPAILGSEGAGTVEAIGCDVQRFKVGDLVAYAGRFGAYAEKIAMPADRAAKLPASVSPRIAAASMLKGMTAELLINIWPLAPGDTVLVHAAAGGVGGILTQWLKSMDVVVIATVGTEEKAKIARANGCDHVILYDCEDVAQAVQEITASRGVKVVYDSVGKATFEASMASIARRGLFVSFGNASGPVPPFAPLRLSQAGSIFFTRPTLFDFIATPDELDRSASALFDKITSGTVTIDIGQEWALSDVSQAHVALEGRKTRGASLLIP